MASESAKRVGLMMLDRKVDRTGLGDVIRYVDLHGDLDRNPNREGYGLLDGDRHRL
jgi:hypothetical protein